MKLSYSGRYYKNRREFNRAPSSYLVLRHLEGLVAQKRKQSENVHYIATGGEESWIFKTISQIAILTEEIQKLSPHGEDFGIP